MEDEEKFKRVTTSINEELWIKLKSKNIKLSEVLRRGATLMLSTTINNFDNDTQKGRRIYLLKQEVIKCFDNFEKDIEKYKKELGGL